MKRLPKAQQKNKDKPRRKENMFNICFLRFRKKRWIAPHKCLFQFWPDSTTSTYSVLLCVTKWTHKKMHKINDNKILGSMNALMSFNILSVAILAESAKYPTTQPSSRDNAIWDALPQTLLPLANFWWRPIYLNKMFCFAILISVIFIQ